jgi:very-short-patch-repair endonuclease
MGKIYNQESQGLKRRWLRHGAPMAEVILWKFLKGKNILGFKFRRQYSVGTYVIDFFCAKLKLAIEIDGEYHYSCAQLEKDKERQSVIEEFNIVFLRFPDYQIFNNIKAVIEKIKKMISEIKTTPLSPPC